MILIIDNYDSFVHNVARHLTLLGGETRVVRNDVLSLDAVRALQPAAIVISPGPCTPAESGVSRAIIETLSGSVPILGVCLGHQCIGEIFGGSVVAAAHPMHGLSADIRHQGERLFAGLPNPLGVGRYHSLIVRSSVAMEHHLIIDAVSEEGEIMALSHRAHPTFGVQFHPESILTPSGMALFGNFLALARRWNESRIVDAVA